MQTEIEAKFADIDPSALRERLMKIGAICIHGEILMKRCAFDSPMPDPNSWMRVRDEGDKVTLSYKTTKDRTLHGTKEASVTVGNFDAACALLAAMGMKNKSYQETKREKWKLGGVEVTIDTWPWIPTFIELEGPEEGEVKDVAKLLGLDWSKAMYGSVEPVYQMHYDFTEEEINHWPRITFFPAPGWLLAKKKQK